MTRKLCLTFDVDWVPDFMIDDIMEMCVENNVKSTWFVTHYSPALDRLRKVPQLIELGIHPNFLSGSSQGSTTNDIIDYCLSLVPNAKSVRTHALFQNGPLLQRLGQEASIEIDSSIFLPEMPNIRMVEHLSGSGILKRVPIFWADDYHLLKDKPCWNFQSYKSIDGIQVFLFHPIHVFLNSTSRAQYGNIRARAKDLASTQAVDVADLVDRSTTSGIKILLKELFVDLRQQNGGMLMRDFLKLQD